MYWHDFSITNSSLSTVARRLQFLTMCRNLSRTVALCALSVEDPGGTGPPIFGKVYLTFLHCIQCLKTIFLKLNLDFIVAEIRGVFGSVGDVSACVWIEIVAATVFCSAKAQFWMIYPRPFWSQKYMPDCRKSHLIFQNFLGEAPQTPRRR